MNLKYPISEQGRGRWEWSWGEVCQRCMPEHIIKMPCNKITLINMCSDDIVFRLSNQNISLYSKVFLSVLGPIYLAPTPLNDLHFSGLCTWSCHISKQIWMSVIVSIIPSCFITMSPKVWRKSVYLVEMKQVIIIHLWIHIYMN